MSDYLSIEGAKLLNRNAERIDLFVNDTSSDTFTDENSVERQTITGITKGLAFYRVGTFGDGYTLTNTREVLLWDVADGGDGHEYGWTGTFPKVVSASSSPSSSGGISYGAWVERSSISLRDEVYTTTFESLSAIAERAGYNLVDGSFQNGATTTNVYDVVWDQATGHYWGGVIGTVTPGDDPSSNGRTDYFGERNIPAATGTADAIVVTFTPPVKRLVSGAKYSFTPSGSNTTATTLAINGLTAKEILGQAGLSLQGSEISGLTTVIYNETLDKFVIDYSVSGKQQVSVATQSHHAVSYSQYTTSPTESASGIVRRATDAEEVAGTSDVGFLTPLGLRNALNATGSAPVFALRAWASFRQVGTQAINASGNILSITDVAVGRSTFTFSTAMQDVDYAVSGLPATGGGATIGVYTTSQTAKPTTKLAGSCQIVVTDSSVTLVDIYDAYVFFVR